MLNNKLADTRQKRAPVVINPLGKRLYSLKEGAEYLGRSVWGVRELIWSHQLPVVKQAGSRKMYLDIKDLDAFIEKNKAIYN